MAKQLERNDLTNLVYFRPLCINFFKRHCSTQMPVIKAPIFTVYSALIFLFLFQTNVIGQAEDSLNTSPKSAVQNFSPKVYLDCERCDPNFIRQEISYLNYVRDPGQADIHLFITHEFTGGGGREYELTFIGQDTFDELEYSFKKLVNRNATWDETREQLNHAIELGIIPYALQTPIANKFQLNYNFDERFEIVQFNPEDDPWKQWVFEIYAGGLSLNMESNQTQFDSRWGFFADKISEEWKIRFRPYFNYDFKEIQRENEPNVSRKRHRHGVETYVIKSIDEHWSAGLFGDYLTRNDQNYEHLFRITPGIEYSLFPYQIATRKAITFVYQLGFSHTNYYEETIYNKTQENLLTHQLRASVQIQQPWGAIYSGLEGSHYFHDVTKRRAEFFGSISVRLLEGLSLNFNLRFEMINDQLSLPKGDASLEDVLLQQRELATDFDLYGSIAISYTFGSDFVNVVNTRF